VNVRIEDAPPYGDFMGYLLMEIPSVSGVAMSVVGVEVDGSGSIRTVPSRCIVDAWEED